MEQFPFLEKLSSRLCPWLITERLVKLCPAEYVPQFINVNDFGQAFVYRMREFSDGRHPPKPFHTIYI